MIEASRTCVRRTTFCLLLSIWAVGARGGEPAREFLDKLRESGYYDSALDYLDQIGISSLVPSDFKDSVDYEKAITLLASSRIQVDLGVREKQIDDAQRLIQQFVAQHDQHPLAGTARGKLGDVIVERGLIKLELSKRGNKATNLTDARKLLEEAAQVFTKLQEQLTKEFDGIPRFLDDKDAGQRLQVARRDHLRSEILNSQLQLAGIREHIADTFEPGSNDAKKALSDAAAQFESIHDRYRTIVPGLFARLYQARCLQKQKKIKEALSCLHSLLDERDSPEPFRQLRTATLRYAMECWLDPSEKKYLEAIERGRDWVAKSRPNEDPQPDWLLLRLYLAKAYVMQAEETKRTKPADRSIGQSLGQARAYAAFVARYNSEYQKEAQALLADLGGNRRSGDEVHAENFAAANTVGKEAIAAIQTTTVLIEDLAARLEKEQEAKAKAGLQTQLKEAQSNLESREQQALDSFGEALRLADNETDRTELNMVRYYLCYLYYMRNDFWDAAAIGEFVAKRYPDHPTARQCAKIAMASYLKLYAENVTKDKLFETDRVISVAEFIATSWPGQPEAEEAVGTLIPFMINSGQLDRAQAFLAKIPKSSPRRGPAELKTGQAMWAKYLAGMQELVQWEIDRAPAGVDLAARRSELDDLKKQTLATLSTGYGRLNDKVVADKTTLHALLSLSHVYVESQQPTKAIEVLEHPTLGPLTLVTKGHATAADAVVVEETYKTALRAYIGALAGTSDRTEILKKAQETMTRMKSVIGGTGGQERLVAVFVSLARSLEDQLKIAAPDAKVALSKAFESFLIQIRNETTEFSVLNWVAETFMSMGVGFESGRTKSDEASRFYSESKATFEKILSQSKPTPAMTTSVQVRLALLARKQRDFKSAMDTYSKVLAANQMKINFQVEAAKTMQEWATDSGNGAYYDQAIVGNHPGRDGRNVVWGWGRIAQATARNNQFRDTFHEANVNLAVCRELRAATLQSESKTRLLNSAFNGVAAVRHLYPDLGGEKWLPQYDAVVKRIQKAQGKPTVGLVAIPAPAKPEAPTSGATIAQPASTK